MSEMIQWLYGLQHFGVKLGLDNIRALLQLLGHPESAYRSVLIGGTNGKGSVAAMLDALLGAAGVPVGMFTSPHLVRPNERIRMGGRDITDDELERRLRDMRHAIETALAGGALQAHPSFFEVVTATALETFRAHRVQVALLEVGLGGRLDATNAVDADLSVVVSIDLDHTKTLGPTLESIAGEKAGIIETAKPLVSGAVQQRAVDVLRRTCEVRDAIWIDARTRVRFAAEDEETITLHGEHATYPALKLALAGRHQIDNARIALAAFEVLAPRLAIEVEPDLVRAGLAAVRWPGRLHWIEPRDGMPRFLLDGAHNPSSVRALAAYLRGVPRPAPVMLFGATRGKPVRLLLEPLDGLVQRVVVTRPPLERGLDPHEIAAEAREIFDTVEVEPDPARALQRVSELAASPRYALVAGSLYLVGEVLGLLTGEEVPGPVAM